MAQAAEAAGFDSVALSDHVVYPEKLDSKYPYTARRQAAVRRPTGTSPTRGSRSAPMAAVTTTSSSSRTSSCCRRATRCGRQDLGTAASCRATGSRSASAPAGCARSSTCSSSSSPARGKRMDEMVEVMRDAVGAAASSSTTATDYDFDRLEMRPVPPGRSRSSSAVTPRSRCAGPPALDGWIGVYYSARRARGVLRDAARLPRRGSAGPTSRSRSCSPLVEPRSPRPSSGSRRWA